jgi:hypothetical protein
MAWLRERRRSADGLTVSSSSPKPDGYEELNGLDVFIISMIL